MAQQPQQGNGAASNEQNQDPAAQLTTIQPPRAADESVDSAAAAAPPPMSVPPAPGPANLAAGSVLSPEAMSQSFEGNSPLQSVPYCPSSTPPAPGLSPPQTTSLMRRRVSTSRQFTEDFDDHAQDELYKTVPAQLRTGTTMLKVSAKKAQKRVVKLKAEAGQVVWESKHAGMLNIESIRELRFGSDARGFREQFRVAPDCEARWMSIIYTAQGKYKILHLVALTPQDFSLWKTTLSALYDQRKELMGGLDQMRKRQSVWLKQHWSNADIDGDQKLEYRDVVNLCRNLNISASEKDIATNFERADVNKVGYLDFPAFQTFVKYLRRRPEIEALLRSIAGSSEYLSLGHFETFLRTTQKSTLPESTIDAIYTKFSDITTSDTTQERTMTIEGFTSFLMSSDNMAFDERELRVCDDMTRPLCEYYISSSHNTYLVGGQLKGDSTAEGYVRALQQGCRSVELDVWDGPDEPVIYHGRTLTSRLPVRDALQAIAKYAFIASPYPVILSMEVHCDQQQQDKLAEILRVCLGKALVDGPLYGEATVEEHAGCPVVDALPSPEDLKYRILVKGKNLYVVKAASRPGEPLKLESEESSSSTSSDSDLKKVFSSAMRIIRSGGSGATHGSPPTATSPPPSARQASFLSQANSSARPSSPGRTSFLTAPNPAPERQGSTLSMDSSSLSRSEGLSRRMSLGRIRSRSDASEKKDKPLMSLSLAALIVYTVGVKWRGLNKKEQYGASHVISLGERRANKLIKEARNDLVAHNRTHLVRAYPAGTRFTSSNFSPLHFWAVGVQLVALNWQTYDLGTEINAALFARNGRSGYVLKPDILRMKHSSEKDKSALSRADKYVLDIEVVSAQQLPKPREMQVDTPSEDGSSTSSFSSKSSSASAGVMSPFVEVCVHTPSVASGDVVRYRTAVVQGNGFNPVFDAKFKVPFSVPAGMLDLAFLKMEVLVQIGPGGGGGGSASSSNNEVLSLGRYTVSLPVLMPGYRHVPLYDHLGQQYLFSSVLIRTQLCTQ